MVTLADIKSKVIQVWQSDHIILPSVTAAQFILESASGTSQLAKATNNLFGIKASAPWSGEVHTMTSNEEVNGASLPQSSKFRKYPTWEASVQDHSDFFTSTAFRKIHYAAVIGGMDYKTVCNALAKTYATDSAYGTKLIAIIEANNLLQWDVQAPAETPAVVKEEATMALSATNYKQFTGLDIWFGHGDGDSGATSSGYQEQEMVRRLQTNLTKYASKSGISIRFYTGNMYANNNVVWSTGRAVIELHLDSAGTAGQGGHVIIQEGIGGLDAIDKNIIEKLKENFGIVNRDGAGYDERSDLANPRRCAAAGINYRLVELFFINDATDRNYFLNNIDEVSRDLISAFIGSEVGQATASQPAAPTQTTQKRTRWINAESTLHLPSDVTKWRIYRENGPYTAGKEIGFLNPAKFGGLSYVIKGERMNDVVVIDTQDFGRVAIYVAPSTGATIKQKWIEVEY